MKICFCIDEFVFLITSLCSAISKTQSGMKEFRNPEVLIAVLGKY